MFSLIGFLGLSAAFIGVLVSVLCFVVDHVMVLRAGRTQQGAYNKQVTRWACAGYTASLLSFVFLLVCCAVLVYCFFTGDVSIKYVVHERTLSDTSLTWLYKLAGLWAGRSGSLLFWSWLIALFTSAIILVRRRKLIHLDSIALLCMQLVLAAFLGVMLFAQANMPFTPTPASYFTSQGELSASAQMLGMNWLLEHWAMVIHPPTLFVGYAGFTVPFAYAIASLVTGDASKRWVEHALRPTFVAWLFLSIGIGLGAIWAYVVLGWGGYWGWDAVENASLLSWLIGVALIHTFVVYRQRGAFKRWGIMCSCLAFGFVIVGTFISRSGIVQSVHAFEGDPVSLGLFGLLIGVAVLAGLVGLILRWKRYEADTAGADDVENMLSRDAAFYFNNIIMVLFTFVLTYMTISQALPAWMPFGHDALGKAAYNAIARPLGLFYLLIMAFGPLMGWGKTNFKTFVRDAKIPALCSVVLFVVLMAYFVTTLYPSYVATINTSSSVAQEMREMGPSWYYNGLAVVGFFIASVLFFNSLFILVRALRRSLALARARKAAKNAVSRGTFLLQTCARLGGFVAHCGVALMLIGLIGSSMYVTEKTSYLAYDGATDTSADIFTIKGYDLHFKGSDIQTNERTGKMHYTLFFDVAKDDKIIDSIAPSIAMDQITRQQKLSAAVTSSPLEDLFVVYRGTSAQGQLALDVRVNPLVSAVWLGFYVLIFGVLLSSLGVNSHTKE